MLDVGYPDTRYCSAHMRNLNGTCLTGKIDCYAEVRSQYPKRAPARNCVCNTFAEKHVCTCCILCGSKADSIDDFLVNQDDDIDYIPPREC